MTAIFIRVDIVSLHTAPDAPDNRQRQLKHMMLKPAIETVRVAGVEQR